MNFDPRDPIKVALHDELYGAGPFRSNPPPPRGFCGCLVAVLGLVAIAIVGALLFSR